MPLAIKLLFTNCVIFIACAVADEFYPRLNSYWWRPVMRGCIAFSFILMLVIIWGA